MYRTDWYAGVDEAGRGPLAGAVVAAAVVLSPFVTIQGLKDSKKLSEKKRIGLSQEIRTKALDWSLGRASAQEIDHLNILNATMLAMKRAVEGLHVPVDYLIVDGNRVPEVICQADWLVKGDDKLESIMAASIIAKVARDEEMTALDRSYPGYGFSVHKGYPTASHLQALQRLGPCPVHRLSFGPCRKLFE